MALYQYRRSDGTTFEVRQKMSEAPLTECPETGQPVERVISGGGFVLKGGGWADSGYDKSGD